jgi:hypothetical protein
MFHSSGRGERFVFFAGSSEGGAPIGKTLWFDKLTIKT